jgi:hypothetical protein
VRLCTQVRTKSERTDAAGGITCQQLLFAIGGPNVSPGVHDLAGGNREDVSATIWLARSRWKGATPLELAGEIAARKGSTISTRTATQEFTSVLPRAVLDLSYITLV